MGDRNQLLSKDLRRLHVGEYHQMIDAGVLREDERVELIEGVLVNVSPQNADHSLVVERLSDALFVNLPPDFVIRCQLPLALSQTDEPEPDVAVLERATHRSRREQPTTARLIFEVAADSLRKDREIKAPLYARAAVPEYVIVDLKQNRLEVHRDPDARTGLYVTVLTLHKGDTFSSASVPGLAFAVTDLLA